MAFGIHTMILYLALFLTQDLGVVALYLLLMNGAMVWLGKYIYISKSIIVCMEGFSHHTESTPNGVTQCLL